MAEHTCHNCIYSCCDAGLWLRRLWAGEPLLPSCANHPRWPGQMREVPGVPCRNYRPRPALPGGDVRLIPLGDGFYAYVDAADYEWLSQYKWHMCSAGYAGRRKNGKTILMHRQIMQPPKGKLVDHMDGNKGNNCRCNLRVCTPQENQRNARKESGLTSRFKGVSYNRWVHKWFAAIKSDGHIIRLGYFDEEVDAARAYDHAAVEWFGEFARLNFPEEWPPERRLEVYAAREKEGRKVRTQEGRNDDAQRDAAKTEGKKVGRKEGKGKKDTPTSKSRHAGKGQRKTKATTAEGKKEKSRRTPKPEGKDSR